MSTVEAKQSEFDIARAKIHDAMRGVRIEPRIPLEDMNQGEVMKEFRYLLDLAEEIEEGFAKKISKATSAIKAHMIDRAAVEGTDKFASDFLSVTIKDVDKLRITGDWAQVQQQLIDAGYGTAIQRRVTEKHVMEAFYAGDLRLPEGLDPYIIRTTNQRRKN